MKVSVAMCTYNGERYIRQQLDSIFAQTRLPEELVVCDDGSRDATLDILEEYRGRGVDLRVFRNEKNLGFMENFKKCLSLCTGDILFLCDQDDAWTEDKVSHLHDVMECEPQILSLCSNFYLMDTEGNRLGSGKSGDTPFFDCDSRKIEWKRDQLYKIRLATIFANNIGPGCAQVIRRELVPAFMSCTLREPHDFLLNREAALRDGLYFYDVPLTWYRIHGNQTCGIPYYPVAKFRREYKVMAEEYWNVLRELIYHLFFPNSEKVHLPPEFDDETMIAYYDALEMPPKIREEYERWKGMSRNRKYLYAPGPGKWKYFLRERKYNRYLSFGYAPVELLRLRAWDLAVLLKR